MLCNTWYINTYGSIMCCCTMQSTIYRGHVLTWSQSLRFCHGRAQPHNRSDSERLDLPRLDFAHDADTPYNFWQNLPKLLVFCQKL